MEKSKISVLTKVMLLFTAILLFASLFVPVWRIELDAAQYPEGLVLQLYANKIGGNVDIINGLNHYIGMKTLHTKDFIEFKVLPYIISFFGLLALITLLVAKRKALYALFISFILFGVLAAVDFYRWNYEYGHNLNPDAPIKVPGMAYQPPLLGFKKLLNFGAYSIPDTGGWMLFAAGLLMLAAVLKESRYFKKVRKPAVAVSLTIWLFSLSSCSNTEATPIKLNTDHCDFCKMTITDGKYGAEIITKKGRVYKFDDIMCMVNYVRANADKAIKNYYVHDFEQNNHLIPSVKAFFISGGIVNSPMQGNTIAFSSQEQAKINGLKLGAKGIRWNELLEK